MLAREAGKSSSQASNLGGEDERAGGGGGKFGVVSKLGKCEVKLGEGAVHIPCEQKERRLEHLSEENTRKAVNFVIMPGIVAQATNPSIREIEARRMGVQVQPQLHSKFESICG